LTQPRPLPYGSWPSPISIASAVAGSLSLREPRFDRRDLYCLEGRPAEAGRSVIVRRTESGGIEDVTPAGFNVRTSAHEYGGGAHVIADGVVHFSNFDDGRLYRQAPGEDPQPITPPERLRYADLIVDAQRDRLIAVVEDHRAIPAAGSTAGAIGGRIAEPTNSLAAIDPQSGQVTTLAAGYDFYSSPRLSHDGGRLAWLSWRHPNMPWDGCELWVAELDEAGSPRNARLVAGGPEESIVQPEWAPDGSLVFVSDTSGWWNLYRLADLDGGRAVPLAPMAAEFAGPQWVFGFSWYGIDDDATVVAICHRDGRDELWRIPAATDQKAGRIELPHTELRDLVVRNGQAMFIAGQPTEPAGVVLLDLPTGAWQYVRRTSVEQPDPAFLSAPAAITFPTTGGALAHALYYPPVNAAAVGPAGELPPLVVMSHGGPTSRAGSGLSLEKQVFTSRGFAVVDVNYGGSNGHGREYMRRLDGGWGIVDVDDCINAARYLVSRGLVDESRMAIRGGSAGGYTTLCALVFHDVFAAGASHYGVGDLEALARETHKLESHYLDRLVAPYPEQMDVYRARSPIHFMDRNSCPVIVFQGLDDRVVPPAQAERIVAALQAGRVPHAYLPFAGEGHGFRIAANITRALEAENSFYSQVFGFTLADDFEPVSVAFLAAREAIATPDWSV
jgi:dipeptidyl aminopeptidase/acylaminoacyl peptidase